MFLKKNLEAILVKHDGVFYICKGRRVFNVNEVGARIFDLCDGKTTSKEIAEKIAKKFHINYEQAYKDICQYIDVLLELSIVKKIEN